MGDYVYNMSYNSKGVCLIINNDDPKSPGAGKDADRVQQCFGNLGFVIRRHDRLGVQQMVKTAEKVAKEDHSACACFVFVLISHGHTGESVYGADGSTVDLVQLFEPFKGDHSPSLIGKPKVFIVEAGRGEGMDHGVEECDATTWEDSKMIPHEADLIYAFSTVPGYVSWGSPVHGSWYIQTLCGVLEEHAPKQPLLWILDRVNHVIAHEFESKSKKHQGMKQMPQIVSQLTKQLYLV